MAGYFGHVGGHVPPYSVGGHGLSHPAPNIDFFSQMAPPPCGKLFVIDIKANYELYSLVNGGHD